jgi:hypothetical protein
MALSIAWVCIPSVPFLFGRTGTARSAAFRISRGSKYAETFIT